MLDKELPALLHPDNAPARRRKYPILSMEKVVRLSLRDAWGYLEHSLVFLLTLSTDFRGTFWKSMSEPAWYVNEQSWRWMQISVWLVMPS